MTLVVLAHRTWKNLEEAEAQFSGSADDVAREWHWSLWQHRRYPWNDLTDGTIVGLVHTWPGGSRLGWLVTASDVLVGAYSGWREATEALATWSHLPRREIETDPYTIAKREVDPPLLLAWKSNPFRHVNVARPEGLTFPQSGWMASSLEDLRVWGVDLSTPKGATQGAGRRLDVESKTAIEMRAVAVALEWCTKHGWHAAMHVGHDKKPWDIEATQGGRLRYMEVKGTTGALGAVDVTCGEVKAARVNGDAHAIAIVCGIELSTGPRGEVAAGGGRIAVEDPWHPADDELTVVSYHWERSGMA